MPTHAYELASNCCNTTPLLDFGPLYPYGIGQAVAQKQMKGKAMAKEIEVTEIENKLHNYWYTLEPFKQVEEESTNVRFKVWHESSNTWAEFMVHFGTDHIKVHDYWQPRADRMGQIRALGSWQAMDKVARQLAHYAGPGDHKLTKVFYKEGSGGAERVYSF